MALATLAAGCGALLAAGGAGAAGAGPCGSGALSTSGTACTYEADGTFTVPTGVSAVTITATGAAGQAGSACAIGTCLDPAPGGEGGAGAQARATLSLPTSAPTLGVGVGDIGAGGAGGGADDGGGGGAGGGASVVSSGAPVTQTSTSGWLIVAAGGGGGGGGVDFDANGGGGAAGSVAGSGANGATTVTCTYGGTPNGLGGTGASDSAAGTGGAGGHCNNGGLSSGAGANGGIAGGGNPCGCDGGAGGAGAGDKPNGGGGGGGGGYYGGGGGGAGGGAGSSYVAPGASKAGITTATGSAPAQVVISWSYATTLNAYPQLVLFPPPTPVGLSTVAATLSSGGSGVPGPTVSFSAGGTLLCSAITGANGTASCIPGLSGELAVLLANGYSAMFSANGGYLGSSASTPAIELGTGLASQASAARRAVRVSGTLTRAGQLYATITSRTRDLHTAITLEPRRALHGGRYVLTLQIAGQRTRRTISIP